MLLADCSAGAGSLERAASWTGQTAGKTKRSTEQASAYRNGDGQFLVRTITIIYPSPDKFVFCPTQPVLTTFDFAQGRFSIPQARLRWWKSPGIHRSPKCGPGRRQRAARRLCRSSRPGRDRSGQAGRAHPHLRPEGLSYREGGESALTEEEEEW